MADNTNGTEKYTKKYEPHEINPLKFNDRLEKDVSVNIDDGVNGGDSNGTNNQRNSQTTNNPINNTIKGVGSGRSNKLSGHYNKLLEKYEISSKARNLIYILSILLILFIIISLTLIILWPKIPDYMKTSICIENECFDASAQIVQWSNDSVNKCDSPYEWACGKFEDFYKEHDFYQRNRGDFNYRSFMEYEDISEINNFMSRLKPVYSIQSIQVIVTELRKFCLQMDFPANIESNMYVRTVITHDLRDWKLLDGRNSIGSRGVTPPWEFRSVLSKLQNKRGVSAFFKVIVEPRPFPPYDYILTIDAGDLGLPNKAFYNLEYDNKIISEYKILLRDTAITFGITSEKAKIFADEIFNYEKRIVESTLNAEADAEDKQINLVITLKELQHSVASLPIIETIQLMFTSTTKLTDKTPVLVKNLAVLRALSNIVASTNEEVLNNFLAWSLVRKYLPYLSLNERKALENFESKLYGFEKPEQQWYFCSKLISKWAPFAIRGLQQNSTMVKGLNGDLINYDFELAKIIFSYLRLTLEKSAHDASWLNTDITKFIVNKLKDLRIQVGIPSHVLKNNEYFNEYYQFFSLKVHFFVEQTDSQWEFAKFIMAKRLQENVEETEKIIDLLFPLSDVYSRNDKKIKYSPEMNMIVVAPELLRKPYFNHQYPISINFARFGSDLAEVMLDVVRGAADEYKRSVLIENSPPNPLPIGTELEGEGFKCIEKQLPNSSRTLLKDGKMKAFNGVSLSGIVLKSFKSLLRAADENNPIHVISLPDGVTYDFFGLRNRKRLPGLRIYDDNKLFTLASLQRHCAVFTPSSYVKPMIDGEIHDNEQFNLIWKQSKGISKTMNCATSGLKCDEVL